MKVNIVMPKMGESINEGTILKWHKKKGDYVKKDEIIFEISTDKVDTEIPSPVDGILSEIKAEEQETVNVDTVVAVIETDGQTDSEEETVIEPEPRLKEEKHPEKPVEAKIEEVQPTPAKDSDSTNKPNEELIDIPMPKMGESVMEGTIIKWNKKPGEQIKKDEILFEISTDKVDTEVPSPENGILAEILVNEQETVPVGTVIARLSLSTDVSSVKPKQVETKEESKKQGVLKEERISRIENNDETTAMVMDAFETASPHKLRNPEGRKFYSPLVLNIAQKENVSFEEMENIPGSGIEGRITKKDILSYIDERKKGKVQPTSKKFTEATKEAKAIYESGLPTPKGNTEIIPMNNIRQKIMQHMVISRDTSVHVSAVIEIDMTKIHNFIKTNKDDFLKRENVKLTYMPFIAYACIKALKEYPYMNASIDGTNIVLKRFINLGFAVAVEPNGLIVPNIKNADEKNIIGLTKAIADLSNKSRTKKLIPDDISNGTFTITNYGVFGTLFGTPIINQPEVAILGVGTVTKKPVVVEVDGNDMIAVRHMMYLTLSHDHRLVDGMLGGRFLDFMKKSLENFDIGSIL